MATEIKYWLGSHGPFPWKPSQTYKDGEQIKALRVLYTGPTSSRSLVKLEMVDGATTHSVDIRPFGIIQELTYPSGTVDRVFLTPIELFVGSTTGNNPQFRVVETAADGLRWIVKGLPTTSVATSDVDRIWRDANGFLRIGAGS